MEAIGIGRNIFTRIKKWTGDLGNRISSIKLHSQPPVDTWELTQNKKLLEMSQTILDHIKTKNLKGYQKIDDVTYLYDKSANRLFFKQPTGKDISVKMDYFINSGEYYVSHERPNEHYTGHPMDSQTVEDPDNSDCSRIPTANALITTVYKGITGKQTI